MIWAISRRLSLWRCTGSHPLALEQREVAAGPSDLADSVRWQAAGLGAPAVAGLAGDAHRRAGCHRLDSSRPVFPCAARVRRRPAGLPAVKMSLSRWTRVIERRARLISDRTLQSPFLLGVHRPGSFWTRCAFRSLTVKHTRRRRTGACRRLRILVMQKK